MLLLTPFYRSFARKNNRLRKWEHTVAWYEKVHTRWLSVEDKKNYAAALHECGRTEEAIALLDELIEQHPEVHYLYGTRAHIFREIGREEEAIQDIDRAIAINPESFHYWYTRALAYQDTGHFAESVADFREAIRREDPSTVYSTWYEMGVSYLRLEDYEQAIAALEKCVEDEEKALPIFYYRLAEAYKYTGDAATATHYVEKAVERHVFLDSLADKGKEIICGSGAYSTDAFHTFRSFCNDMLSFSIELAELYVEQEEIERAIEALSDGLVRHPDTDVLYYRRGLLYHRMDEREKAAADLDRALALDPEFLMAYVERAILYMSAGEEEAALQQLQRAKELDPAHPLVPYWMGQVFTKKQQMKEALSCYDEVIELEPDDPINFIKRGEVYEELGRYAKAEQDYTAALELHATADVYMKRSYVRHQMGQYMEALLDLDQAAALDTELTKTSGFLIGRGMNLLQLEAYEEAEQAFMRAMEHNPGAPFLYEQAALCKMNRGKYKEAIAICTKGLEVDDRYYPLMQLRGFLYYRNEEYVRALEDARHYTLLHEGDASGYYNMGLVYKELADTENALAAFTRCIEEDAAYRDAYMERAHVYFDILQWEEAASDLARWACCAHQEGMASEAAPMLDEVHGFTEQVIEEAKEKAASMERGFSFPGGKFLH
ncbi:tetratricopeptide repeat protein [Aneurinibacillus sp. BA2021]|nr:tetratricopeptide repeat protein [Aneurinibacillus sp. BA2021]